MPACRDVRIESQLSLPRIARLLLVFLLQSFAVLLAGFIALFVDFEPGWSAQPPQAALIRPGDARTASLLPKTENRYANATSAADRKFRIEDAAYDTGTSDRRY
jgi:hypothetical protein